MALDAIVFPAQGEEDNLKWRKYSWDKVLLGFFLAFSGAWLLWGREVSDWRRRKEAPRKPWLARLSQWGKARAADSVRESNLLRLWLYHCTLDHLPWRNSILAKPSSGLNRYKLFQICHQNTPDLPEHQHWNYFTWCSALARLSPAQTAASHCHKFIIPQLRRIRKGQQPASQQGTHALPVLKG